MIRILQPFIPHYRESFFERLSSQLGVEVYCYENLSEISKAKFSFSGFKTKSIWSVYCKGVLFYSPLPFLKGERMVLMLNIAHVTTWLLLLTKFVHRKKITLWGHGISVKRYLKEESKPSILMRLMIGMADSVWFYTNKEKELWNSRLPKGNYYSLNNTVSNVDEILKRERICETQVIKEEYGIKENVCLIFCARFETEHRRAGLLVELAKRVPDYALIIIGDGRYKPDFGDLPNVYDFGAVYDESVKNDLFTIADIYFQPAWVGLSIVEAMAYGLPVLTLKRTNDTLQCVEYAYLIDHKNAIICTSLDETVQRLKTLSNDDLANMQVAAKQFVSENLTMNNMVNAARCSLTSQVRGSNENT